jgi:hypothetical protein
MPEIARIEVHATTQAEEAIVSVRVDGCQIAQIAHFSGVGETVADAMVSALASAIAAIAREEQRRAA